KKAQMSRKQETLAAMVALAGLAAPAMADTFTFNTSTGAAPSEIHGVPVVLIGVRSDATYYQINGDLSLLDGDTMRIAGDRPARITVLNNVSIDAGAQIDAAADGRSPGPGGGA